MSLEYPGDDKRCDWCDAPGIPYEYNGIRFSGLFANEGEKLCPRCLDRAVYKHNNQPVGWAQVPASQYVTPIDRRYHYIR